MYYRVCSLADVSGNNSQEPPDVSGNNSLQPSGQGMRAFWTRWVGVETEDVGVERMGLAGHDGGTGQAGARKERFQGWLLGFWLEQLDGG